LEGVSPDDNECRVAIVAFCPFHDMKAKASARAAAKSLFVHIDLAHQFLGEINDRQILMVECVYGGPVCATVIEEMAYLGVRTVLGYGYSGSLRDEIQPGTIVLASAAITSDGTSHQYTGAAEVHGSEELMELYGKLAPSLHVRAIPGKAWTTDAIYREYPSSIKSWQRAGADFVNMDTSPFYAASEAVGMRALYFSLISDYVGGAKWDQQFQIIGESRARLHDMLLRLVNELP
jgi:uridine phosphorylase